MSSEYIDDSSRNCLPQQQVRAHLKYHPDVSGRLALEQSPDHGQDKDDKLPVYTAPDPPSPNNGQHSVVAAVGRSCVAAARTAIVAADLFSTTLTSAVGYLTRPIGAALAASKCTSLSLDILLSDNSTVHIAVLGRVYAINEIEDRSQFIEDCRSRILFTYRTGFVPITKSSGPSTIPREPINSFLETPLLTTNKLPTPQSLLPNIPPNSAMPFLRRTLCEDYAGNIVSDAGWGCMVRATQMALAQSLITLRLGRHWRLRGEKNKEAASEPSEMRQSDSNNRSPGTLQETADHNNNSWQPIEPKLREIIYLFQDSPVAPLSVHNIAQFSSKLLGIPVGHWLGPTSCGLSATALMTSDKFMASHFPDIRPVIFPDGLIIHSKVLETWIQQPAVASGHSESSKHSGYTVPPGGIAALLIICVRLGTVQFNIDRYARPIAKCFSLKQFQGASGGGAHSSAHYFFGECGPGLLYLDPHIAVHSAFTDSLGIPSMEDSPRTTAASNPQEKFRVSYPLKSANLKDFHTFFPYADVEVNGCDDGAFLSIADWRQINPSLALFFLCQAPDEYFDLVNSLSDISKDTPDLFEMIETSPDFAESAEMNYTLKESTNDDFAIYSVAGEGCSVPVNEARSDTL